MDKVIGTALHLSASLTASVWSPLRKLLHDQLIRQVSLDAADLWDKSFLPTSQKSDEPLDDLLVYALLTVTFLVLLVSFRRFVANPIARAVLTKPTPAEITKFGESCCEFWHYGVFTVIGCSVAFTMPWIWPSSQWWEGYTAGDHADMRDDLRCWYIMDASRYSAALFSLIFLEHRRKDFVEMCTHHCAAIAVTVVSYQNDFTRVGAMVKLVMDPADVLLHLAKMCKYTGGDDAKSWGHFCAERFFEAFAVCFFITRIICFGYIVYSTAFEAHNYFHVPLGGWACVGLLCILLSLQIFWMSLIVKLAIKTKVQGEAIHDNRSDSEGEEDEPATRKKKSKNK